jgi:hypothetical protein
MTSQTVTERPMDDKPNPANGRYGIASGVSTPADRQADDAERANIPRAAHAFMGITLARQIRDGGPALLLPAAVNWCYAIARRGVRMLDPDERVRIACAAVDEIAIEFEEREASPSEIARASIAAYEARMSAVVRS